MPLLAGLLLLGWLGSAVRYVGDQDALFRTYEQARPCQDGQAPPGCYAWLPGHVTEVDQPDPVDSATRVRVQFADGSTARVDVVAFAALAAVARSVGTA